MATTTAPRPIVSRWSLWFGLFGGLTAWILHLAIGFALVYDGCAVGLNNLKVWLWIVTVLLALIALAATWAAYYDWSRTGRPRDPETAVMAGRTHFMALTGLWLSGLSLLMIVAMAIPIAWLDPCGLAVPWKPF